MGRRRCSGDAAGPLATAPPASVAPQVGGLRLVLASGASTVVDYQVPAAGELQMICHLPGHAERGHGRPSVSDGHDSVAEVRSFGKMRQP